ncbi:MAG TPA: hypothetical protein VJL87_03820 [Bdellovibrionota bacterium]|nr:hypothetical protein [Bdellovibrionota bacterium]
MMRFFSVIFLIFPFIVFAEGLETVQVRGEGVIVNQDTAQARSQAMNQARRNAIDLQLHSLLGQDTIVANSTKLEQRIYQQIGRFIKSYKELGVEQHEEVMVVSVEAVVDVAQLKQELANAGVGIEFGKDVEGKASAMQKMDIIITGVNGLRDFEKMRLIQKWLTDSLPKSKPPVPRRMSEKEVVYIVEFQGTPQNAAAILQSSSPGFKVETSLETQSNLLVRVKQ